MVRFFRKIGEIARGETPEEGNQRRAAEKIIRSKERAAMFQAKQEQRIALAKEKQKLLREAEQRRLKARLIPQPRQQGSSLQGGFFNAFSPSVQQNIAPTRSRKRKGKKGSSRRRPRFVTPVTQPPKKFDILGL